MTSSARFSEVAAGDAAAAPSARSAGELETLLEELLFASSSQRSASAIAHGLAGLARPAQELALRWTEIAAQTHSELGYLVAMLFPAAWPRLKREQIEAWVIGALDQFDRSGGRAAMDYLRDLDGFLLRSERGEAVVRFDAVEPRLGRFVQGLSGRPLRVAAASDGTAWTDTETIFLPESIADSPSHQSNLAQYRLRAALLWGQARFGTFNGGPAVARALAAWPEAARALAWLTLLEALRIERRIGRVLPGLAAEIAQARPPWPDSLAAFGTALRQAADPRIADSLAALEALRRAGAADWSPPVFPHAGRIDFAAAGRVRAERVEREQAVLRTMLGRIVSAATDGAGAAPARPQIELVASAEAACDETLELRLDGEAMALPVAARAAISSLLQDLGEVPPEALVPAGPAPWVASNGTGGEEAAAAPPEADFIYDEWDCRRNAFRTGWCHLHEHAVGEGDAAYVPAVRRRHAVLIGQLRRRFETLRNEDRVLRRQPDGEEIDLDALVAARADRRAGTTVSPNLFARRERHERSLAVMLMVDMSGSTQGWINDAEREALVMLGETVETLGDAWAIYGFSGWTRTRCDLYRVKTFDEAYDQTIERRIAAIVPKDYTRMGVAIRHLSRLLAAQPAKHRLLVTLSDGKPDDYADEYRSRYGIEDTRHALLEARARGVRSYCVTIDRNGADYLRQMYGPARYTVLDDVRKLPLRIADIYRRLAT